MANLEETAVWTPAVYQLETTDPVLGGPVQPAPATGGIANRAALALANRTAYLKQELQDTTQEIEDALEEKADINSPAFTGIPTAPTPAAADDSNKLATTAYVTAAISASGMAAYSINALPTTDIGPVLIIEACEFWIWVDTPHYTGYRSPLCGRPVDGHTVSPLVCEIDAVGGILSKSAYPGLWGYAQENSLLVTQSIFDILHGSHVFVDVSATHFRVPDLRNMFRRYTGTNVDNHTARNLGSPQADAFAHHFHNWQSWKLTGFDNTGGGNIVGADTGGSLGTVYSGVGIHGTGGAETRPVNVAFYPRIHI